MLAEAVSLGRDIAATADPDEIEIHLQVAKEDLHVDPGPRRRRPELL